MCPTGFFRFLIYWSNQFKSLIPSYLQMLTSGIFWLLGEYPSGFLTRVLVNLIVLHLPGFI